MPPDEFKGWIFFFFIHLLLGIMLIGFIRTLIADPGRVPNVCRNMKNFYLTIFHKDWNKIQEEKVKSFRRDASTKAVKKVLENERLIYANIHKNKGKLYKY